MFKLTTTRLVIHQLKPFQRLLPQSSKNQDTKIRGQSPLSIEHARPWLRSSKLGRISVGVCWRHKVQQRQQSLPRTDCGGRLTTKIAPSCLRLKSADCKRGRRKGATSKNVKNRQKASKSFRHFSTIFAQGKKRQKSPKSVKKCFDTFRQFSRGTIFPAPFGGL